MALKNRLDRLERIAGVGDCLVCTSDTPEIELNFCEPDTSEPRCPACGRPLVAVVTWGDGDELPSAS